MDTNPLRNDLVMNQKATETGINLRFGLQFRDQDMCKTEETQI